MGDRCSLTIYIHKSQEEEFNKLLAATHWGMGSTVQDVFNEVYEDSDGDLCCQAYETNYAWYDHRKEWAKSLNFCGSHSEGGSYGAYDFVAWQEELFEAPTYYEGGLVVTIDDNGNPHPDSLAIAKRYLAAIKAYNAWLETLPKD